MDDLKSKFASLCEKGEHPIYFELDLSPEDVDQADWKHNYFYFLEDDMWGHVIDGLGLFDYRGIDFYQKDDKYYAKICVEIDQEKFGSWSWFDGDGDGDGDDYITDGEINFLSYPYPDKIVESGYRANSIFNEEIIFSRILENQFKLIDPYMINIR